MNFSVASCGVSQEGEEKEAQQAARNWPPLLRLNRWPNLSKNVGSVRIIATRVGRRASTVINRHYLQILKDEGRRGENTSGG